MKRIICILLAAVFVFSFIACGETKPNTTSEDTTEAPVIDTVYYEQDELPDDLDFDGETVTILSPEESDPTDAEISVEELSGNVINDSIYNRELFVEDRLDVEIENIQITGYPEEILKMYNTGEDIYDAYVGANHSISQYAFNEYLVDLNELEYLSLDKPWWSQKFNDEAELFDKLYLTTGSMFLSLLRDTFAVYYNKDLAKDYEGSNPELGNLYDIVSEGKWTFDKFVELGGSIYKDINGNSQRDLDDIYGIAYLKYIAIDAVWSSFDLDILTKTSEGWYEFDMNTDKLVSSFEKLYALLFDNVGCISANVQNADGTNYSIDNMNDFFANGTNLFLVSGLGSAETDLLRNMQDDYGILPFPKYDEAQKEYYSYSHDEYRAVMIPITNSNPEVIAAVLEAIASYSYRETVPLYLDTVLKGQYMSDAESRKMIDIIVDGFEVDAAWIYLGTLGCGYTHMYRYGIMEGDSSFSSMHQGSIKTINIVLKSYRSYVED